MRKIHRILPRTLAILILLPVFSLAADPGRLLPSETFTLMLNQAMNNPSLSRRDVYEQYMPRLITVDLDQLEQYYLGEVYFFALMPEESRDAFYALRHGDSMLARVAWQRIIQIRFRAFQMYERAARDLVYFRETFPADPRDREYLSRQVLNFGTYYAEQGAHDQVVELVEAELTALDFDGAYNSLLHPATFIASYIAVGKKDLALSHMQAARDGLTSTLTERLRNRPEEDYNYPLPADRYAFFLTPVNEKLGFSQHNDKFRALIAALDAAIAELEAA